MIYEIHWLEYFPHPKDYYRGRKQELSHSAVTGYLMGDMEVEAWEQFEAANNTQAKQYVKERYPDLEIFTVVRRERAFTEEDI